MWLLPPPLCTHLSLWISCVWVVLGWVLLGGGHQAVALVIVAWLCLIPDFALPAFSLLQGGFAVPRVLYPGFAVLACIGLNRFAL